ncbi:MAG: YabP/YqfC family sporulation protein [Clostridiales bacterium]|nr:YabP/YqfC family sporulation protein [Clostridiales bacterium]
MGKKERWDFMDAAAEALELPADVVAGAPLIELVGKRELRMENHRGILSYGPEEISISGGRLLVRVRGEGLALGAMSGESLLITGTIRSVELE